MKHACGPVCAPAGETLTATTMVETLSEGAVAPALKAALTAALPAAALKFGEVYRSVYSRDGSYFEYVPQAVVRVSSVGEVQALMRIASEQKVPLTFRAGGTSLSGQTVGTGIVADLRLAWKKFALRDGETKVWVEPGLTVKQLDTMLAIYGKKIGPDPASSQAAMLGGVLSNNSSGMQAGVEFNSYHTLDSIEFVLPSGRRYDTARPDDRQRFALEDAAIHDGLARLRDEVRGNADLVARIRRKYQIKNVTGYAINSFVDFDEPIDILAHLLIGAEGTLAFIASATLRTLPLDPHNSSTLLFFATVAEAAAAVPAISQSGADACEIMDLPSLKSALGKPGVPDEVINALPADAAALLIDYQAETPEKLQQELDAASKLIAGFKLIKAMPFSKTAEERSNLWVVRDGIFTSVAGARTAGDAVILEDVAVPVEKLADLVKGLQALFAKHGYHGSIFGHAKAGNIHFLITDRITDAQRVVSFGQFMDEVVDLVLKLDGSLKAEHGTGRAIAPFVEREWGTEAYSVMKRLKNLIDPGNLMNPGVMINADPKVHLAHLKSMDVIGDAVVDRCIECGFCEHVCPTRYATLTPRQRIQSHRVRLAMLKNGLVARAASLSTEYEYAGRDTCVADGMCQTVCPVGINTGHLTDWDRANATGASERAVAEAAAHLFHELEIAARAAIDSGVALDRVAGERAMPWITGAMAHLFPGFPQWSAHLGKAPAQVSRQADKPALVYFPACVSRMMGSSKLGKPSVMQTVLTLAERAGIELRLPKDTEGVCCSQPFGHKGFDDARAIMANRFVERAWQWSEAGRLPIMCDVTSCVRTLTKELAQTAFGEPRQLLTEENLARYKKLVIIDIAEWLHDEVLPKVEVVHPKDTVVVHPTCACHEMALNDKILAVAQACAKSAVLPRSAGCCGAGGDRGFLHPEVTASALKEEGEELKGQVADGAYSFAKTCEIVLSDRLPFEYESMAYLVAETTARKA